MENLTGEVILKQLRKRYTPSLICTVCLFVIAAVCTGICAYMRGMTDVVTIIAAAISAVILIMLLIVLFHWIFVTKDRCSLCQSLLQESPVLPLFLYHSR